MSDDAREHISLEEFTAVVANMHPTGMPSRIEASEFEPVPGQEAMNIFLVGESAGEPFYYRFGMRGTVAKGYRVSGLFRGNGPYPASPLRQGLPVKRSAEFSATATGPMAALTSRCSRRGPRRHSGNGKPRVVARAAERQR
jgi:hypothetical protein